METIRTACILGYMILSFQTSTDCIPTLTNQVCIAHEQIQFESLDLFCLLEHTYDENHRQQLCFLEF
ncbi:hypothetical protein glysoja_037905 [Glycine soja]|uniref:Uncharacterized protein n=1 Tax=Glycine soja TaxID=3848 RepID=A0A0B2NWL9_GLYSO|nr:hypothetical protein glysoja_037905 [Glycine soja]